MLRWQGVEAPTFSLNGPTRQMILTATRASAFDSIIRHGVGLLYQRNYLKCLLFHHPECQRAGILSIYTHPQTITTSYITPPPLKNHCFRAPARCRVINLHGGFESKVIIERSRDVCLRAAFVTWPLLYNTIYTRQEHASINSFPPPLGSYKGSRNVFFFFTMSSIYCNSSSKHPQDVLPGVWVPSFTKYQPDLERRLDFNKGIMSIKW